MDVEDFEWTPVEEPPLLAYLTNDGEYIMSVIDGQIIKWIKSCEPLPDGRFMD